LLQYKAMKPLYIFSGKVKRGKKRGRDLGFPTANIPLLEKIPEGIYLSLIQNLPSLTFIGSAKTFGEEDYKAEVYILDFNENLYGKLLNVTLLKKIRDNQKFSSEKALIEAMEKDKEQAEEFFKTL